MTRTSPGALACLTLAFLLPGCQSKTAPPQGGSTRPAVDASEASGPFDAYESLAAALMAEDEAAFRAATLSDNAAGHDAIESLARLTAAWTKFEDAAEAQFGAEGTAAVVRRLGLPRPRELGEKLDLDLSNDLFDAYGKRFGRDASAKAAASIQQQDWAAGVRRWAEALDPQTAARLKSDLTQTSGNTASVGELAYEYGQPELSNGAWKINVSRSGDYSRIRAAAAGDPLTPTRIKVLEQAASDVRANQYRSPKDLHDALLRHFLEAEDNSARPRPANEE